MSLLHNAVTMKEERVVPDKYSSFKLAC